MSRFQDRESPAYFQAVAALEHLREKEGVGAVRRAYADAIHEQEKARYAESRGVKEATRYPCVHTLIGKRCPARRDPYEDCPQFPGQDHLSGWNKHGKLHIAVSQPYGMSYDRLTELVAYCEEWGLEAHIDAHHSWHFPGETVLVEFHRKGTKRSE